ncbi:MAG TPA: hypothetical protein VM307_09150 [Egibacteraceae bacterium]|nr:hypothetical protein [Egibacteraceae bacterium]
MRGLHLAHRALILVLVLLAAACGPPQEPLRVGMREVASNIVLGGGDKDEDVPPPPLPPTAVAVTVPHATNVTPDRATGDLGGGSTYVPPDTGSTAPPPPPPPPGDSDDGKAEPPGFPSKQPPPKTDPPCVEGDPRQAPTVEAPRDRLLPPAPATYTFRNAGSFEVSGADANEGVFDGNTKRTVKDVSVDADGSFRYAVEAELAGTVTTTRYLYRNQPVVPQAGAEDYADLHDGRGLYLDSIVTEAPDGTTTRFTPRPQMMLLPIPASNGFTMEVRGADPTAGTTMSYTLTVVDKQRVDACGDQLDAIRVRLTEGRIVGPQSTVDFDATYDFGTQYGGLMLRDAFVVAGREGLNNVSRNNVATINQVPKPGPKAVR